LTSGYYSIIITTTSTEEQIMELTYSTTLYFEVPEEYTPDEYIRFLEKFPRMDMVSFATDVGDGGWGVEE
jgi:hypothetical protein